jgi:hypothetical protein
MSGGGKSGGAGSTTYNYYGTIAGGLCVGPVDELVSIILNGKEVWPGGVAWAVGLSILTGTSHLYVFNGQTWYCTNAHTASTANAPGSGLNGWTEYTFARSGADYNDFSITADDGTYYGVIRLYWGTQTQTADPLLASSGNDKGDQHPDYKGICYVVLRDFLFGQEIQSGPNVEIIVRKKPTQSIVTGSPALISDGQCNVAAAAVEILTDKNLAGQGAGVIDGTSFNAVATLLDAQPLLTGGSVLIDSCETLRAVFEHLMDMIDGYSRYNPTTKSIEIGVFQHGVTPGSYVTLTEDALAGVPKFSTNSWQQTKSRATINYPSRQFNYQQVSDKADDPRLFTVLGTVREQVLDRPYICRPDQAVLHGRETLRVIGHAVTTCEVSVRRELARTIRAGSYVLLDVDLEPNANSLFAYFRVIERRIPSTGPITLKLVAENTLAPVPFAPGAAQTLVTGLSVPAITSLRIVEVPTVLGVERGSIVTLVQRPSSLISGCSVYFDTSSGGTFPQLGSFTGFAARGKVGSNIAATDTTVNVTVDTTQPDADLFTFQQTAIEAANDKMLAFIVQRTPHGSSSAYQQVLESGNFALMEICSVSTTSLVSAGIYQLTLLRGRQNTQPLAFTWNSIAGDEHEVWLIPKANVTALFNTQFDTLRALRAAGTLTPALLKFSPNTFTSILPVSLASSVSFNFPINSNTAPVFALTSPANYSNTISGTTIWPLLVSVTGVWSDPDGNLVQITSTLLKSGVTGGRSIGSKNFAPVFSYNFSTTAKIESPGTYTLRMVARDSTNQTTTRDVVFIVTGSGAAVCAYAHVFDINGDELLNPSSYSSQTPKPVSGFIPAKLKCARLVPYGPLKLVCTTPGSTITFQTSGPILRNQTDVVYDQTFQTYTPNVNEPLYAPAGGGASGSGVSVKTSAAIAISASASGMITAGFDLTINTVF